MGVSATSAAAPVQVRGCRSGRFCEGQFAARSGGAHSRPQSHSLRQPWPQSSPSDDPRKHDIRTGRKPAPANDWWAGQRIACLLCRSSTSAKRRKHDNRTPEDWRSVAIGPGPGSYPGPALDHQSYVIRSPARAGKLLSAWDFRRLPHTPREPAPSERSPEVTPETHGAVELTRAI